MVRLTYEDDDDEDSDQAAAAARCKRGAAAWLGFGGAGKRACTDPLATELDMPEPKQQRHQYVVMLAHIHA